MRKRSLVNATSETKQHYKMYKAGKNWLFAGITLATFSAVLLSSNVTANAATDTTATVSADSDTASVTSSTSQLTDQAVTLKANSTSTAASASSASTSVAASTASTSTGTATNASQASSTAAVGASTANSGTNANSTTAASSTATTSVATNTSAPASAINSSTSSATNVTAATTTSSLAAATSATTTTNTSAPASTANSSTSSVTNMAAGTTVSSSTAATSAATNAVNDTTAADNSNTTNVNAAATSGKLTTELNTSPTVTATATDPAVTSAATNNATTVRPQMRATADATMAAATASTVTLTSSTPTVGYGITGNEMTITANMTANAGDVIKITVPTDASSLILKNVPLLPNELGTTTKTQNADGSYTITDTMNNSGIYTQVITLGLVQNSQTPVIQADELNSKILTISATINGVVATTATITQNISPAVNMTAVTRTNPVGTAVNGSVPVADVVPDTNYVYTFKVNNSVGLQNDAATPRVNSALNAGGTTITIPVPAGFTLDSAATNQMSNLAAGTTITQAGAGADIVITVAAGTGQIDTTKVDGYYLVGSYAVTQTAATQTLTAAGPATFVQNLANGTQLTGTGGTWSEVLLGTGDDIPAAESLYTSSNGNSTAIDATKKVLLLDSDPTNDPQYINNYRFDNQSALAVTDAQISLDIPDGIDATGLVLPPESETTASYLPGTTSYGYVLTLADGTTETGTAAAGTTITATSAAAIRKIVLTPNYLAAGADTISYAMHLIGTLSATYDDGSAVTVGDQLEFGTKISFPSSSSDTDYGSAFTETVVAPTGMAIAYAYQGSQDPGKDSGYIALQMNGNSGQTTDRLYNATLYFVLPKAVSIEAINIPASDLAAGAKVTTYTTADGRTGVKIDYSGTGLYIDTSEGTNTWGINVINKADALPGNYDYEFYITSPDVVIKNTTKVTDASLTDGDTNAVLMSEGIKTWKITTAAGTYATAAAKGNQDVDIVPTGTADKNGDSELDFYTSLVNTAGAAVTDTAIAVNLPEVGDDQGSTYTYQLTGPITVPSNFTTATGTGDPLNATVLYSTSVYTPTTGETAPNTTGYVTADQVTDWSTIRSVIIEVGDIASVNTTGAIKLSGTVANFIAQGNRIGYLQTYYFADSSTASINTKATSIAITGTSTVGAQYHYVDANGDDQVINLADLTQTLTDNQSTLTTKATPKYNATTGLADSLPTTLAGLSTTDKALIPDGYHLVTDADGNLKMTVINSTANYDSDDPNLPAELNKVSQYYFDGDTVQYELIKDTPVDASVTYVDDTTGVTVKTDKVAAGLVGETGTYIADLTGVPAGYIYANGQSTNLAYTLTADDSDDLVVHLTHQIVYGTITSTRTINYVVNGGTAIAPTQQVQTAYWKTVTDKVTGASYATAQSMYGEVVTPILDDYHADQAIISAQVLGSVPTAQVADYDENLTVIYETGEVPDNAKAGTLTVKYVDENGNVLKPAQTLDGYVGNSYSVTAADLTAKGYTLDTTKSQNNYTGSLTTDPQTITFVYQGGQTPADNTSAGKLTVNYVDENGNVLKPAQTLSGVVGNGYNVTAADLTAQGYTLDTTKSQNNYTGSLTTDPQTITFVYQGGQTPADNEKAGALTVNYVDENGNVLKPAQTLSGVVGNGYNVTAADLTAQGYTLDTTKSQNNYTGSLTTDPQTITFVYQGGQTPADNEKAGALTVNYVDENGNVLKPAQTLSGVVGNGYNVTAADLTAKGYTLDTTKSQNNYTGSLTAAPQTITFVYHGGQTPSDNQQGSVIVRYVDENGQTIINNLVKIGHIGNGYQITPQTIKGYTYVGLAADSAALTGRINTTATIITLVYRANVVTTPGNGGETTNVPNGNSDQTTTNVPTGNGDQTTLNVATGNSDRTVPVAPEQLSNNVTRTADQPMQVTQAVAKPTVSNKRSAGKVNNALKVGAVKLPQTGAASGTTTSTIGLALLTLLTPLMAWKKKHED
ncbi:MucBP domain-containing protein [Loigolactobacillus binensis]|nr:MucBP domain-containing protein [Loigolactobacillus binensis]